MTKNYVLLQKIIGCVPGGWCASCIFVDKPTKKEFGRQKKKRKSKAGIEPVNTETIQFVVLVTRREGIALYKTQTAGFLVLVNHSSKFKFAHIGSVIKENEHANRRTKGHLRVLFYFYEAKYAKRTIKILLS